MSSIVYGGLDVHKQSIVAHLICKETGEVVSQDVPNDRACLLKAVQRWSKLGELRLCYEASGAGFVVKRWLDAAGVHCDVIAPSLIPKASGDRVKTDERDARNLASLFAAGLLRAVRVPTKEEETVRALVRLREDLTLDMTRVKNRILKYLATLGFSYTNGKNWTLKFRAWLRGLSFEPIQRLILDTHLEELDALVERRQAIDRRIEEIAQTDLYREKVQRLMTLRGIGLYSAMVLATETGDASRFGAAPAYMSYFGLVPTETSSGDSRRTGKITKAGSRRARWILTEAARNQRRKPCDSEVLRKRREGQPAAVIAIAKKAEKRLHDKFSKVGSRKDQRVAVTAVAREMAGFVWAILTLEVAAKEEGPAVQGETKEEKKGPRVSVADPDAIVLKSRQGYKLGYNAQAAVDKKARIIAGATVCGEQNDVGQLIPVMDEIEDSARRLSGQNDCGCGLPLGGQPGEYLGAGHGNVHSRPAGEA